MRTQRLVPALVIGASLLAGGLSAAPAFAQAAKPAATANADKGLSIPQIHEKLTAAGYTKIEKVERERDEFEVKATDKNGKRVKLHVDAQNGEVIDARQKDEKRVDSRDSKRGDQQDRRN